MISPTTLMCHFEFYGYSNLASKNRPPLLLRFLEQALSPVPPNTCMGSALYVTGDRQVPLGLTCLRLRVHRSPDLTLRPHGKLGPQKLFGMMCRARWYN